MIIENNCDLAPNITIYTGYHDIGDNMRRAGEGHNGRVQIGQRDLGLRIVCNSAKCCDW